MAAASVGVLAIGVLAIKLAELQVRDGVQLAGLARANSVHRVVLEADRGIIYDRHGTPLVENSPAWSLVMVPAALPVDATARAMELAELARITGVDEPKLANQLLTADAYAGLTVASGLTQAQELALQERLPQLAGATIQQRSIRTYVDPLVFGHVVGYVGPIDGADAKKLLGLGYQPNESI
ncbi:MAG TPA: hypothetical protein VND54_00295, partial [Candidatus Saccharimonadales bacterium]|nr:hypothetical protein [Candidatus Saccharimonadales bacterium]